MKALIRNPGETVRESDGVLGIDWITGAPLTNAAWCGGPYTLVLDYKEPESSEEHVENVPEVTPESEPESVPEDTPKEKVYVINGREFTEPEIKNLLISE